MKKQWIGIVVSSCVAALIVLGMVRLIAPQLLGIPLDLEIVQSSDAAVPFFDVVLNEKEIRAKDNYIKDPHFKHRYRPLHPKHPTDLLGFRNAGIPNKVDVVVVGDSQTWGNNAPFKKDWPSRLAHHLELPLSKVYNASVGGWGAVEYLEIAKKMLLLKPKIMLVAIYTGNDPLDAYMMAYAKERWERLRPSDVPEKPERPHVNYPPKESELWTVAFDDGVKTTFTPHGRYACNRDHPAANAGWVVIENVVKEMTQMVTEAHARPVFTLIPTKELVFYPRVQEDEIEEDETYAALVEAEAKRIDSLKKAIGKIDGAQYVDVVAALQQAVRHHPTQYYPTHTDGHPTPMGYDVIAKAAADGIRGLLR